MKNVIIILLFIFIANAICSAQDEPAVSKIEAAPEKGFSYPYFLYVPKSVREAKDAKKRTILVIPNNSGKINDDLAFHEADAKRRIGTNGAILGKSGVIVLMPVFPRPETDWKIYTHALDRDSMTTDKKEYKRFDLQLLEMIEDARKRLSADDIKTDKKVLMMGYSASGMFVNRFTFLHPSRVKAAAIGSPGGWAIAPVETYREKTLPYPVGVGDLREVSGEKFDLKNVRKVPLFVFLGDKDDNDSVVFRDGYEDADEKLVFELFGKTPVERWEISKTLYKNAGLNAEFKLYPNVAHQVNEQMRDDLLAFFGKYVQ